MTRGKKKGNDLVDDRLKFAVDFTNIDLTNAREGDLMNLREDIWNFFNPKKGYEGDLREMDIEKIGAWFQTIGFPQELSREQLAELQVHIKQFFTNCLAGSLKEIGGLKYYEFGDLKISPFPGKLESGRALVAIRANVTDSFMFELTHLLRLQSIQRIFICPECKKLFLKIGVKQYCSRPCVLRANKRAWRDDPKNKQKEKVWDYQRFEKQKSLKKKDGKK